MDFSSQQSGAADSSDATRLNDDRSRSQGEDESELIAETKNRSFALRDNEEITLDEFHRARHLYIVGKSGSGKSTLAEQLALSDIDAHKATVFIDFHGDSALRILDSIPASRTEHVCYIDLSDTEYAVGFNPLVGVPLEKASFQATAIVQALKDIFGDSWGPRLEWFLWNGLVALIERGDRTLGDLPPLYYDKAYRKRFTCDIADPIARQFWTKEYPSYDDRYVREAQGPILNKIGQLLASPAVRNVLFQVKPRFNLAVAFNTGQAIIVNLAKGAIGDAPARLIGSLIVSRIQTLIMARADKKLRNPVSMICDEFQNFGTEAFAVLFSESRKYGLQLTVAHQHATQLEDDIRHAIIGNAGTIIAFKLSPEDARLIAPEFDRDQQPFSPTALTNLEPFNAVMKQDDTFHIETIAPDVPHHPRSSLVIKASRDRFARKL